MSARVIFVVLIAFFIGSVGALYLRSANGPGSGESGTALIGGSFQLTSHEGRTVTDKDFRGKYMLVAFGYTYCPDICPAELNIISKAVGKLGNQADRIVPIFITVDPERDTVDQMAAYISSFHPKFVGLTGSAEQIRQAASAYRVYYAKAGGSSSDEDDYLVDHSTFIYLMDPKGDYVTHFGYGITSDELADKIRKAIGGASV